MTEDCDSPGDEDGDGLADCDDPACFSRPECRPVCGDGKVQRGEACDDGNAVNGDGCDSNCTVTACGNGIVTGGEACDDGNTDDGDGCDSDCTVTACGNGIVTSGEACDDGNAVNGDGCDNNCTVSACGNGELDPGEACDDGNAVNGDGCDSNCTATTCGNGIVTAGEECDDGNAIDGDGCNGCRFAACNSEVPAAPGHDGSLPLPGNITALVADPSTCFVYALNIRTPEIVVISTASKRELTRIRLPAFATDLAVSPNGAFLVAGESAAHAISVIDRTHMRALPGVATRATPQVVRVDNNGIAYYADGGAIAHVDLRSGVEAPGSVPAAGAALAMSSGGRFLYSAGAGTTSDPVLKYDLSSGSPVEVDRSTGYSGNGVYVSPQDRHVYFAQNQLDGSSLAFVAGLTEEPIHVEDAAQRFAIGRNHVFDAELVHAVATLPHRADAAVLTAADQELWYYTNGQLYYVNVADLIGNVPLGVHEVDPEPISSYRITRMIHDPQRPRLYGLDAGQAVIVVIDTATLQPTRAIRLGSTPTDIDVDPAGATLLVGHHDVHGFSRIDLASLTFDRIVRRPSDTTKLIALGTGRAVTAEDNTFITPALINAVTGEIVLELGERSSPAFGRSADRATLFVGGTTIPGDTLTRYAVAGDTLTQVASSRALFRGPMQTMLAVPDASAFYYGGGLVDGNDLQTMRYTVSDPILAVTPDSRLALSTRNVYLVATGAPRGSLRTTALALAISPDSRTAYAFDGVAMHAVNLTAF